MSSYSSRGGQRDNRYYDHVRQSHGSSRSQSGATADDDDIEPISEDLQIILDDDSKFARLLKKLLREERSFDMRIQRIQEFQAYLDKPESSKFIVKLAQPALNVLFEQFQARSNETIRAELARCIGLIGFVMLNEGEPKFSEWIFERMNDVKKNDTQRQLLASAFRRSIENESDSLCLTTSSTATTAAPQESGDKTTKGTEERNKYAVEICKRIRDKLDGSDPDPLTQCSIVEQVRYTIREATDIDNLATLYEGWTSWV